MIRWNLFFEVEKVEQLALIDRLATHHDRPPSLKASGKRNHDSSISTRPFSTGTVNHGRGRSRHTIEHVRFAPKADIASRHRPLTLCANSDLTHCSTTSYSITSSATKRRSR